LTFDRRETIDYGYQDVISDWIRVVRTERCSK
jgi:hypothetical protein